MLLFDNPKVKICHILELMREETDMVLTSLKINSGRESVIDFSIPFLETGITILVSNLKGSLNPFPTNPLVVVCRMGGGMDSTIIIISAPEGARRLIF